MKDIPRVGFVCTGENALELSGAICVAGRLMRHFTDSGYITGGCYSCITPSKQIKLVRERICHMCACNYVVVVIGCDGFRKADIIPDRITAISRRDLPYFSCRLSSEEYVDAESGISHKCFPSRSVAAVYGETLVMSVPADLSPSLGKINGLMSAISFAVRTGKDKAPARYVELEDLAADFCMEHSFQD